MAYKIYTFKVTCFCITVVLQLIFFYFRIPVLEAQDGTLKLL